MKRDRLVDRLLVFWRFGLVGAATAVLYFGSFWLCYSVAQVGTVPSTSISYTASTAFQFFANQVFTFGVTFSPTRIFRYAVAWLINYAVTVLVVHVCETRFGLSPYVGVCLSLFATTLIGFNLSRNWIYRAE